MTPLTEVIEHGTSHDVMAAIRALVNREEPASREEVCFALGLVVGRMHREEERHIAALQKLQSLAAAN